MQDANDKSPPPNDADLWAMVKQMNERLALVEHRHSYVATAFPQNDLGKPDYDGHRKVHLQLDKDAEVIKGYQTNTVKSVLSWLAIGAVGVFILGSIEWIRTHLK